MNLRLFWQLRVYLGLLKVILRKISRRHLKTETSNENLVEYLIGHKTSKKVDFCPASPLLFSPGFVIHLDKKIDYDVYFFITPH